MPTGKRAPFVISGEEVAAGEKKVIHVPVANLYSHESPLSLPVHVIHGRRDGPVMFISAAIHGDELNGVEIVRRLLRVRSLNRLSGTLLAVPVVNGFGMLQQSRYLPDRRDLNRSFPGSRTGSLAARLANIFVTEIVDRCQYGVDLHTAAAHRDNLAQVRANLDDPETLELANAFGVPVVLNSAIRDGSLRAIAAEHGVKTLLFEAGEALRFSELCVRAGVRGLLRVMRHIGMVPLTGTSSTAKLKPPFIARSSKWLRAPATGVVTTRARLGDYVEKGHILARVFDPYDFLNEPGQDVVADCDGIVIGIVKNPLVHEGDAVVHIARFAEPDNVAEELEIFTQAVLDRPAQPA